MTAYLDHAATTPMIPAARAALVESIGTFGNPSSLHATGRAARRAVEESRESIAAHVGARPSEIVFTAGGTEANNLALKGIYWDRKAKDSRRSRILISAIEHHAVLDPAQWLARDEGAKLELLPVDSSGRVDLEALEATIAADPESIALISVMWANNEIGTIQSIPKIQALAAPHGIPVHSDAVQAVGAIPVQFKESGLAALTFSAHKLGGPVGVGALVVQREIGVVPLLHGGGQERAMRSGTVDVAGIVTLAAAISEVVPAIGRSELRITSLRDRLIAGIQRLDPSATLSGLPPGPGRLPGNAHFTFPGCEGDSLLYLLDARGVEVSTGSACQAGIAQPSHVLSAAGMDEGRARGALRFSLGHNSVQADIDRALEALPEVLVRARAAWSRTRRTR